MHQLSGSSPRASLTKELLGLRDLFGRFQGHRFAQQVHTPVGGALAPGGDPVDPGGFMGISLKKYADPSRFVKIYEDFMKIYHD